MAPFEVLLQYPRSPAVGSAATPGWGVPRHTERLPARRSAWAPGAAVLDAAPRAQRGLAVAKRRAVGGRVATHASPAAPVGGGAGGGDWDAAAPRRTRTVPTDGAAAGGAATAAEAAAAVLPTWRPWRALGHLAGGGRGGGWLHRRRRRGRRCARCPSVGGRGMGGEAGLKGLGP
eukprot:TRINITY_DN12256_c0_g1_i1.p3 TRINITY_DN12256_c0_g1~~TRINITY_DN12256_c0_g1_i1.p3  ORF type:complete len:175 (-),score=17.80 TRINITY_DN12256_c0_g1_i1:511-1035(-)